MSDEKQRALPGIAKIPDAYKKLDDGVYVCYGTLRGLCGDVQAMINAQRNYFKTKEPHHIRTAKALERDIWDRLKRLKSQKEDLIRAGWLSS